MKLEETIYSNYQIVRDDLNIAVAVRINGKDEYRLYDRVNVHGDIHGYICSEITEEGEGQIIKISNDRGDHFFGVLMDNGEFGFVKSLRISRL